MNRFAMLVASMGLLVATGCAGDLDNSPSSGDEVTAQVVGTGLSRSQLPPGEVFPTAIEFGTIVPGDNGTVCTDPGDCFTTFTACPSGVAYLDGPGYAEPVTFDYGLVDDEMWLLNQDGSTTVTFNPDGSFNLPSGPGLTPRTVDPGVCKTLAGQDGPIRPGGDIQARRN